MRNSEADQAAWKAHVEELKKQNEISPEPIIDGPKITSPRPGPLDRDPLFGDTVLRQRKNRPPVKKHINAQIQFNEKAVMIERAPRVADSRGVLRPPTPIELEAREVAKRRRVDPLITQAANVQRWAIKQNIERRRQK